MFSRKKHQDTLESILRDGLVKRAENNHGTQSAQYGALEFAVIIYRGNQLVRVVSDTSNGFSPDAVDEVVNNHKKIHEVYDYVEKELGFLNMGRLGRLVYDPEQGALYYARITGGMYIIAGTGIENDVQDADHDFMILLSEIRNYCQNLK